jgi:hypothetical protein
MYGGDEEKKYSFYSWQELKIDFDFFVAKFY